jgi:hypothetical protein
VAKPGDLISAEWMHSFSRSIPPSSQVQLRACVHPRNPSSARGQFDPNGTTVTRLLPVTLKKFTQPPERHGANEISVSISRQQLDPAAYIPRPKVDDRHACFLIFPTTNAQPRAKPGDISDIILAFDDEQSIYRRLASPLLPQTHSTLGT